MGKVENPTNPTKKELFLSSYDETLGHISNACKSIKIHRSTYYDWMENDPDFKQAILDIDERFIDLAESALRSNIENKVQRAIEFYLCNKKKSQYANTFRGELGGIGGEPIKYVTVLAYEEPKKEEIEKKEEPKELESGESTGL